MINISTPFTLASCFALSVTALVPLAVMAQAKPENITVTGTSLKTPVIPVETFVKRAEFASMSISPKGDRLAALVPAKDRDNLVVIDLVKRTRTSITNFTDNDVINFNWVNNDRIFLRVADGRDALGVARFRGSYAVNADGSDIRNLTDLRGMAPLQTIKDDVNGEMLVTMSLRNRVIADVYKLNTKTGKSELLTFDNPGETQSWLLDWNDQPLLAESTDPKTLETVIWYRTDTKAKWEALWKNAADDTDGIMDPIAFMPDGKSLVVASNKGRDKFALFRYDIASKSLGELIFEHPLIDIQGGLIWNRTDKKLVGIGYNAEQYSVKWLDPKLETLQKEVDSALKDTRNVLSFNPNGDTARVLVVATSPTNPGGNYLYDSATRSLEALPQRRPWISPDAISPRQYMPYTARDGLNIPAWVTIPKGTSGKNLPLIVNIHGGPNARVYGGNPWGRYSEAPLFANRGYVVLEPEPRGSTQFGRKHLTAGFKQWGQAMQEDITDGVLKLIKDGIVDKDRVCLYGGSYGGYASLQGVVKDPDMYKCTLPWIAVSDLVLLLTDTLSDTNNSRYDVSVTQNRRLGDIKTDRAMLEKYSPVNHADKIKVPVLLVMGELDVRVPLRHGTSMRDAMNKAGVKNELVIYKGEAHGFNKQDNIVDFFTRAEKFFAQHIGDESQKAAAGVK
jgi:dipeptidyl aminopeptidase/acylaminoacyl peptidase